MGTMVCLKVLVPQTGKAVEGVWPGLVQGWAAANKEQVKASKVVRISFINSVAA